MAGRFVFQKLCSGISRSASPLSAQGSAMAATPVMGVQAASYLNIFRCNHAGAKAKRPPSDSRKPFFVDFVRVKRIFSSSATKKQASEVPLRELSIQEYGNAVRRSNNTTLGLFGFSCLCWLYMFSSNSSGGGTSCCNCQCHGLNPEVKRN